MDDGAYADLVRLHLTLDRAVAAAYGWPASVAQDDLALIERLNALNVEHAQHPAGYQPFS